MSTTLSPDPVDVVPDERTDDASAAHDATAAPVAVAGVAVKPELLRPLAVALLASGAAGLMAGGIFGSWTARAFGLVGAAVGVGWVWVSLRTDRRRVVAQSLLIPVAFVVGILGLITAGKSPANVFTLMGDAVSSGRLLRPPVPFDAGWRPILILLMALVGFAAAWIATAMQRPQVALLPPLLVLGLTAISQPAEGEFIGGVIAFVPLLLALTVLFGGDRQTLASLGSAFELKRAIRAVPLVAGGVALLVVLNSSDFLFPKPTYNPAEKPQKPKAIPLGKVRDRVLFEVDGAITGPWKTGSLDFYDGSSWRLAPFDPKRLRPLPGDGVVEQDRPGDTVVRVTTRDLGTTSVFPGVTGPTSMQIKGVKVSYDPRIGIFRMGAGAVPPNVTYALTLPKYPSASQLRSVGPGRASKDFTFVPKAPSAVQRLLNGAPTNPWDRLDFVRSKLNEVVIAAGVGTPTKAVPPAKVDDLLEGSHEGSPYEIVAAEALLARWAGLPSRIGYGFDGLNDESGLKTVRPKNGANWLEVNFEGFGWIPLIGAPPKAKSSLDNDKNTKFDPNILPSDDVAVELYVPFEIESFRQLYQLLRSLLLKSLPWLMAGLTAYLAAPFTRRVLRRRKRRQWAIEHGAVAQVAVEYAEFRDAANDLNVGDAEDTPLEFLQKLAEDDEHGELAWLVTRSLYGDLRGSLTEHDVHAAREMSESLRRRMFRVQPLQSRILAVLSRASLRLPYTDEVPTVRQVHRPRRRRLTPDERRKKMLHRRADRRLRARLLKIRR